MRRILIIFLCLGMTGNVWAYLTEKESMLVEMSFLASKACYVKTSLIARFIELKEQGNSKESLASRTNDTDTIKLINDVYNTTNMNKTKYLDDQFNSCVDEQKYKVISNN